MKSRNNNLNILIPEALTFKQFVNVSRFCKNHPSESADQQWSVGGALLNL